MENHEVTQRKETANFVKFEFKWKPNELSFEPRSVSKFSFVYSVQSLFLRRLGVIEGSPEHFSSF